MTVSEPRVYTIAPGGDFLAVLAREILLGFPFCAVERVKPPLAQWTILLPTRRAARQLGSILVQMCGQRALLLPTIKPIGDIDDGEFQTDGTSIDIPAAISRTGQVLMMLDILNNWVKQNPHTKIAAEINYSSVQSLNLAKSLLNLVDQLETGEVNLDQLSEAYNLELSDHRTALLSLLSLLKVELPQKLMHENLMGPAARRSLLIRLEAQRISNSDLKGPIIAAGSTGTIPATRALLQAIATHKKGAVVLPGLDLTLSTEDWAGITPDHPQYSLQNLIAEMKVQRSRVTTIGTGSSPRSLLSAELMRPSASADRWQTVLKQAAPSILSATENLHVIKTADRHIEARAIALVLRQALELPTQTAALVTPDRDLAQRVKTELLRWNIVIDDSAGEPLHLHGLAALTGHLLQALASNFSPPDLLTLLSHPDCIIGENKQSHNHALRLLEVAVLRNQYSENGLAKIQIALAQARDAKRLKLRVHPVVSGMTDDDWLQLQHFVTSITDITAPLLAMEREASANYIQALENTLQALAPHADWASPENQSLKILFDELQNETARMTTRNGREVSELILALLREKTVHPQRPTHPRLAIYGVLEARLISADIIILGALNEGIWPAQPDPGPWFNRPMRSFFGLQLPERDIGVSAHDFTQGLGYTNVYLTYSTNLNGAPQLPSRWILRMQTVLQAAGLDPDRCASPQWPELARALDGVPFHLAHEKPRPRPALENRPTRFSVTEVEKLIRDPYGIYAKKILKLEPLQNLKKAPDAALRGTLFHEALKIWNQSQFDHGIEELLAAGQTIFAPFASDPQISVFWWSRFERVANWLSQVEADLRKSLVSVHAEVSGLLEFEISGTNFSLSGNADRIDVLKDGSARIIDYKTGTPPTEKAALSGMSPQLLLEAALLLEQGFQPLACKTVSELIYLHLKSANPAGEIIYIGPSKDQDIDSIAREQLAGFKLLLAKYYSSTQPYLPRVAMQKEDDPSDYDHLSRYQEWVMAGTT